MGLLPQEKKPDVIISHMNKFKKILKSTLLCLRYPYLYPRNRFTGLHHTNWKLHDYMEGWREPQKAYKNEDGVFVQPKPIIHDGIRQKAIETTFHTDGPPDKPYYSTKRILSVKYLLWYWACCVYREIDQLFHCLPSRTEWEALDFGWQVAFGEQLLEELDAAIHKSGGWKLARKIRIEQIKEKFGMLRIYLNYSNDEIDAVLDKYEDISYHTCINCGKPASKLSKGWICPYCDDCCPTEYFTPIGQDGKWQDGEWEELTEEKFMAAFGFKKDDEV